MIIKVTTEGRKLLAFTHNNILFLPGLDGSGVFGVGAQYNRVVSYNYPTLEAAMAAFDRAGTTVALYSGDVVELKL